MAIERTRSVRERTSAVARTTLKKVGAFVSLSVPTPQATLTKAVHQVDAEPWRIPATR